MIRVTQVEEFVSGVPLESSWEKEPGGLGTSSRFGVQEGLPSEMMMRWVLEQNAALIPLPTTTAESAAREHIEAVDFFETVGFEPSLLCLLVDLPQPVVVLLVHQGTSVFIRRARSHFSFHTFIFSNSPLAPLRIPLSRQLSPYTFVFK